MCSELLEGKYGKHPSALGPCIARSLAGKGGLPAIVINPPSADEFEHLARVSGIPEIERKSAFHALKQKMTAMNYAAELGKRY
jgi:butyrate kinase